MVNFFYVFGDGNLMKQNQIWPGEIGQPIYKSYQRYIKDKYFKGYGCVCGRVMSNTFSDAVFLPWLSLTVCSHAIESIFYSLNSVIFYYNIF